MPLIADRSIAKRSRLTARKRYPARRCFHEALLKKLTYASAGVGTPVHLGGALFASMAGIDLLHVPYKGAADYTTAVLIWLNSVNRHERFHTPG